MGKGEKSLKDPGMGNSYSLSEWREKGRDREREKFFFDFLKGSWRWQVGKRYYSVTPPLLSFNPSRPHPSKISVWTERHHAISKFFFKKNQKSSHCLNCAWAKWNFIAPFEGLEIALLLLLFFHVCGRCVCMDWKTNETLYFDSWISR